tara:strand:- start:373 stop:477 length:105 start_codon:yes stop_codon:yes gene_type:complete
MDGPLLINAFSEIIVQKPAFWKKMLHVAMFNSHE